MKKSEREFWLDQGSQVGREQGFTLPTDVTMEKVIDGGTVAFYFRHRALGELGRVRLEPLGEGSNFVCEVAGQLRDADTEKRRKILEPLARDLCKILEEIGKRVYPDRKPPQPRK